MSLQEEKIALIQPGDFIEYHRLYSLERLGSASIATGPAGKRLILVLGKITRRVSIEPRRIQAILREGKVIACFEEARSAATEQAIHSLRTIPGLMRGRIKERGKSISWQA